LSAGTLWCMYRQKYLYNVIVNSLPFSASSYVLSYKRGSMYTELTAKAWKMVLESIWQTVFY